MDHILALAISFHANGPTTERMISSDNSECVDWLKLLI